MITGLLEDIGRHLLDIALGTSGPLAIWLGFQVKGKLRTADGSHVTQDDMAEAEQARDTGGAAAQIESRWQAYSDDMEKRLNKRLDEQQARLENTDGKLTAARSRLARTQERVSALERTVDVHFGYAVVLRGQIVDLGARPRPWPSAIDPERKDRDRDAECN